MILSDLNFKNSVNIFSNDVIVSKYQRINSNQTITDLENNSKGPVIGLNIFNCRSSIKMKATTQVLEQNINFVDYKNIKMIQMNLFTKQKWTHRLSKQTYGYKRQGREKLGVWN